MSAKAAKNLPKKSNRRVHGSPFIFAIFYITIPFLLEHFSTLDNECHCFVCIFRESLNSLARRSPIETDYTQFWRVQTCCAVFSGAMQCYDAICGLRTIYHCCCLSPVQPSPAQSWWLWSVMCSYAFWLTCINIFTLSVIDGYWHINGHWTWTWTCMRKSNSKAVYGFWCQLIVTDECVRKYSNTIQYSLITGVCRCAQSYLIEPAHTSAGDSRRNICWPLMPPTRI